MHIMHYLEAIWDKFALNLVLISIKNFKIYAESAPSYVAIWDEFSGQHEHQSIKKSNILPVFNANKLHFS